MRVAWSAVDGIVAQRIDTCMLISDSVLNAVALPKTPPFVCSLVAIFMSCVV